MKIVVKSKEGSNIDIAIPTGLILNSFTEVFIRKYLYKNGINITRKQAILFIQTLKQFRHEHMDWVLVEVHSSKGGYAKVKL